MSRVYWVGCPYCGTRFYVGHSLIRMPDFPACCIKCHREFAIEDSNPPINPPATNRTHNAERRQAEAPGRM